jgi:hypothetical protein
MGHSPRLQPRRRRLELFLPDNHVRCFHKRERSRLGGKPPAEWTATVTRAMHLFANTGRQQTLELGKAAAVTEIRQKARMPSGGG